MPSLTLSNNLSKAANTKRAQMIINEPFSNATSDDDWTGYNSALVSHTTAGSKYMTTQTSGGGNGGAYLEFSCIPNSEYKVTAVLYTILGGGTSDARVKIGTSGNNASIGNHVASRSGATISQAFSVGNRTSFFISLHTDGASATAYWDSLKIEETG